MGRETGHPLNLPMMLISPIFIFASSELGLKCSFQLKFLEVLWDAAGDQPVVQLLAQHPEGVAEGLQPREAQDGGRG